MNRIFPFIPKSNAKLFPGDFWAIPLDSGNFACGRVIEIPPKGNHGSKTMFLAGLMDWVDSKPPTFESIAGSVLIEQGQAHIRTILENGKFILGNRPLELDKIEPMFCKDSNRIRKGYFLIEDKIFIDAESLPRCSTWGYNVIKILATKHLDKNSV